MARAKDNRDKRRTTAKDPQRASLSQSAPKEADRKKGQKRKSHKAGEIRALKRMRCFLRRFSMRMKMFGKTRLSKSYRIRSNKSRLIQSMK